MRFYHQLVVHRSYQVLDTKVYIARKFSISKGCERVLSNPSLDNNKLLNENANYTCENFERVAEINNSIQQADTSLQS